MTAQHLEVATDGQWGQGTVKLDGQEIQNGIA